MERCNLQKLLSAISYVVRKWRFNKERLFGRARRRQRIQKYELIRVITISIDHLDNGDE
jgi:hypothetical protein